MSKYYCKKSSIETVVSELKTKAGISQTAKMPFSDIANTVDSLVIPTQRGSLSKTLTNSSKTYTVQRGVYTGGTVSVSTQSKTVTLQAGDSTVSPDSGKVLSSVIVPASSVYTLVTGTLKPTKGATSFSVTGLSFKPVGVILILTDAHGGVATPYIGGFSYTNGIVRGIAAGSSNAYGVPITSANVTITNNAITISNIVATEGSTTFAAKFYSYKVAYCIWG